MWREMNSVTLEAMARKKTKWQNFEEFTKEGSTMTRLIILILFLLMATLFPAQGSAQVYKYVDEDGVVHFTDKPTDPKYQSYMAAEPEKKGALGIQPKRPAEDYKAPLKENKKADDLKDIDDLKDPDTLGELPSFSYKP